MICKFRNPLLNVEKKPEFANFKVLGMFQRLEKLKKNAFASVCLFGTDNNSTISGIWVWRGHELVFKLSPDWQVCWMNLLK